MLEYEPIFRGFRQWAAENVVVLFGVLLLLLLAQTIRLLLAQTLAGRRVSRHRRAGEAAERAAFVLLEQAGFAVQEEQVSGSYEYRIDGKSVRASLRADFLVQKRGKTYIAEVKSGGQSAKMTTRNTRRQLLEYLFAFDVDGLLLVDMFNRKIYLVKFPDPY